MKNKEYNFNLGFIRSIALFMILISHLMSSYLTIYKNNNFWTYFSLCGLGLFFLLSGILLEKNIFLTITDISRFYYNKIIRIIPLYWIALFTYMLIYPEFFPNAYSIIINIFFINSILYHSLDQHIITLWYVSVIMFLYFITPISLYYKNNIKKMFFIILIIYIFLIGIIIKFHLIDYRIVCFYPLFFIGVFLAKYNVINKISSYIVTNWSLFCILISVHYYFNFTYLELFTKNNYYVDIFSIIIITLFTLFLFSSLHGISVKLIPIINKLKILNFSKISYASYCIYLFHRPFYTIILYVINIFKLTIYQNILIILSTFILYELCVQIQKLFDKLKKNYF